MPSDVSRTDKMTDRRTDRRTADVGRIEFENSPSDPTDGRRADVGRIVSLNSRLKSKEEGKARRMADSRFALAGDQGSVLVPEGGRAPILEGRLKINRSTADN